MRKDLLTTTPLLPSAVSLRAVLRRWRDVLAVLGLLLLPLAVFARQALLRGVFYKHDVQYYFYPYHLLPAQFVAQGHAPLWNPYAFSGMPLLGDGQTALFYPPNWLFFILPSAAALNYDVLVQFSIAGLGFFLFARSLGLGRTPALVGAIAYMFGGFLTTRVVHLSILSGAALIPLLFFCVERALRTQALRWFAAAAGAVALQTMAGHPQVPIYTALALGLYVLVRAVERWMVSGNRRVLYLLPLQLASIYVLGYGLAAIQLMPWVELARLSPRAAGASFDFVFNGSMFDSDWLLFVFPYLYGALEQGPYAAQPMSLYTAIRAWEHSAYVGIFPLALAAVGLLGLARVPWRPTTDDRRPTTDDEKPAGQETGDRRQETETTRSQFSVLGSRFYGSAVLGSWLTLRVPVLGSRFSRPLRWSVVRGRWSADSRRWFTTCYFALLLLLSLVAAAGKYTPMADLIYVVPVVGKLRDVERVIVLAAFALTMLAAIGMQRIIEAPVLARVSRRSLLLVAAATALIPLGIVLLARQPAVQTALDVQPQIAENLALQRPNAFVPLALAFASAALLVWWSRRPPGGRIQVLAVGLVLLDMAAYAAAFNPTTDPQLYQRGPDSLAVLRADHTLFRKATFINNNDLDNRTAQETLAISWGMVYGIEDINGFNSLQSRRYTDYLFGPQVEDVSYGYLMNEGLFQPGNPVLSALNVKYLLVPAGLAPHIEYVPPRVPQGQAPRIGSNFRQIYANKFVRIYENTQAYPRAYFVDRVRVERDPSVVLRTVTASGFDGRQEALIEAAEPPALPRVSAAIAPASVSFVRYTPNQITLLTSTGEARFLVLSEMYFPGWRAYVDGVETPIYQTNYLFRGVVVPSGQHTLVFAYRPTVVLVGAAVSLATLAIVVGLLILGRRSEPL
ncbi:MAG: YfhO family protein [Roseiflexaceae bacterium]